MRYKKTPLISNLFINIIDKTIEEQYQKHKKDNINQVLIFIRKKYHLF